MSYAREYICIYSREAAFIQDYDHISAITNVECRIGRDMLYASVGNPRLMFYSL